MSRRLLDLRHVPDDEADDVRALLDDAGIDWYETPPSRWGVSAGAIWITDPADWPRVRALMDDYQTRRRERVTAERETARREGREPTFAQTLREQPLRVVATLIGIALMLLVVVALPALLLSR